MKRAIFFVAWFCTACATGASLPPGESGRGRTEVWADNCARCHPIRSPASYGDAQWEVALFHHAARAWISMPEMKTILELMQAAN